MMTMKFSAGDAYLYDDSMSSAIDKDALQRSPCLDRDSRAIAIYVDISQVRVSSEHELIVGVENRGHHAWSGNCCSCRGTAVNQRQHCIVATGDD